MTLLLWTGLVCELGQLSAQPKARACGSGNQTYILRGLHCKQGELGKTHAGELGVKDLLAEASHVCITVHAASKIPDYVEVRVVPSDGLTLRS